MEQIKDCEDKNVRAVIKKHVDRAAIGLNKYGVTTERSDLARKQWLQHAQDEVMDQAIYLQRLMHEDDVFQLALQNEVEAIARYVEETKDVWGKNLAENIRARKYLQK